MNLHMSELVQGHPLLQTEAINELATYWPQHANSYFLSEFLPLVNYDVDKIVVELSKQSRGGMTPMVQMNAESPIWDPQTGRGRMEFEAASWREKIHIGSKVLYDLRKFGTKDELMDHATLLRSYVRDLEERLARRMEWLRRQVLFFHEIEAELEDKTKFTMKYPHPEYLDPVAGTKFDDYANVDVIAALQDVVEEYITDTGRQISDIILPHGMIQHFARGAKFQELVKYNLAAFRGSHEEVRERVVSLLGVGDLRVSSDRLQFSSDIEADAAQGATELLLGHAEQLKAGDNLYIVAPEDHQREKLEVASVDGNVVTLAAGIQREGGFTAGSPLKWSRLTVPQEKILFFGEFEGTLNEEGTRDPAELDTDVNRWGEIVSTRSHYADMENPRPGLYNRTIDNTNGDPPHIEYILGIRALPRIIRNDAWMTFTVLDE